MTADPVYVACLTPPGAAAIATVGLSGRDAWSLVKAHFQPRGRKTPIPAEPARTWLGRLTHCDAADDVVVTIGQAGEIDRVEIHCHGGAAVVRWLLNLFRQQGAIEITYEEWLRRTATSPIQAEAALALTHALTLRTAGILLDQFHGAFERELRAIDSARARSDWPTAAAKLEALCSWIPLGRHLTEPWRVVVAGAPNAGKSSLINALLGYQRAITSPIPGTTRDLVTALTAFDGWPVELIDSAGIRADATGLEALGITQAENALTTADLCLWVVDRTQERPLLPPLTLGCQALVLCNKTDLVDRWQPWEFTGSVLLVSALTSQGLQELADAIVHSLVPRSPPKGTAVPFAEAIVEQLCAQQSGLKLKR